MSTPVRISNEKAGAKLSRGTVCVCAKEDHAALTELYLATFPNADAQDLVASFSSEVWSWFALKNNGGDISVALLVGNQGGVLLIAEPSQSESREIRDGFVELAEEAFRALHPSGVRSLTVMLPVSLRKLGGILERSGLLGKEMLSVREMQFTDSAEVSCPKLVIPTVSGDSEDYSISSWFNIFATKESS